MPIHLTGIKTVTNLPDASLYATGYPVVHEGVIKVVNDNATPGWDTLDYLTGIATVVNLPDASLYPVDYPVFHEGAIKVTNDNATPGWDTITDPVGLLDLTTVTATSAYTIDATGTQTFVLADATGGAFNVTLPAVASGRMVIIKKTDAAANTVTVVTPGAETIDGAADEALVSQYDVTRLVSDGANWFKV